MDEAGLEAPDLSAEQKQQLRDHAWCGNVRELRNVIERFVVMGGRLEFVSGARDPEREKAALWPQSKLPPNAIDHDERKLIYAMLLKELLQRGIREPLSEISAAGARTLSA